MYRLSKYLSAFVFTVVILLLSIPQLPVSAQSSRTFTIYFYEGNRATQDVVCSYSFRYTPGRSTQYTAIVMAGRYDNSRCQNDEIRSLYIVNAPAGVQIDVYDDSSCTARDDHSVIYVFDTYESLVINTFEPNMTGYNRDRYPGAAARVDRLSWGNLDGKVSCIKVHYNPYLGR